MNVVAAPFRQLIERRLWPVALLLVAALAAVPVLLAKTPSSDAPAPTAVASADAEAGTTTTLVSASDPAQADEVRKVLGARKDPFRPDRLAKPAATSTPAASGSGAGSSAPTGGSSSGSDATGGGGGATTPTTPTTPVVTTPATPKKTYDLYSLEVAFGDSSAADLTHREVKRLTGLPSGSPAVLYLGLLDDHKTAVFLVSEGVKVQGDGHCEPTVDACQTLRMKAGDTVFLTKPGGKQFELDLIKVHARKTTSAKAAEKAKVSEAKGGRDTLRDNLDRVGRYRYSEHSGALKLLGAKAWKASAAKASAAKASAAAASSAG